MSQIPHYLEVIAEWHREHHPLSVKALQAPLTLEQIQKLSSELPFSLPEELIELYQWHNGQSNNRPFFGGYTFYPLEEAIEEYQLALETSEEEGRLWKASWFPVFGFQGDYFVLDCESELQPSPIFMSLDSESLAPCWYENLEKMLLTLKQCFEKGAYFLDEDEILLEDYESVEQIRLSINQKVDRYATEEELSEFEPHQEIEDLIDGSRKVTSWLSEHQHTVEFFGPDGRKRWQDIFWGDELRRKDIWEFTGPSEAVITSENYSGMLFSTRAYADILPGGEVMTRRVETIINGEVVSEEDFNEQEED
ncbi:hypothetical protein COW36_09470 [bacterium (Candidatus Blackallbacteria) CG17_big_fil_post_rev_8_21_14_2_50_48_46]|uniref:Knr4/Smi1-like domain-containing protein n=1 Tax=bacterium (Candidatus Blackallbacteria) CG17_big_fil_post_rev_8_21_14_2_50_48_46 TaxID=2014261 RepID=A0A2M7G5D9_9BACT|nr:MAG: hypothetical protein COW64_01940 [bacterium (Candidatus Blackallbacteria) CG18_big_fil_WC_8_21_14_2_50_49_26]PIW17192.1 MAG: hypothetical protein COW36_09470 [bacterium (Candidatus Blackallbacteria) CG17_big_fil_post_rev_8_21_14_2_50_48_46]PIW50983.1 MAG: hypothetical protein COW20_00480 [bacterium (Candidatus Blackallbacteria) CG13_big_fil_rev_8_21_14_2_50_49_14]